MFAPGVNGWPTAGCPGCSMVADQIIPVAHLHARDTSFAMISRAPLANIQGYKKRMGWDLPWYSSAASDFNDDFGVSTPKGEIFGLSVFFRDGDDDLSHLFHERARRRDARPRLYVARLDAARPAGGLGGLTRGVAADAAVSVVAAARRVRQRLSQKGGLTW